MSCRGYVGDLVLQQDEIAGIEQRTLEVVNGGGHLVWFDDPGGIGDRVQRFLAK